MNGRQAVDAAEAPGRSRRLGPVVGAVVGVPVLGYGIWGLLRDHALTHPPDAVTWIVGSAVVNDLVLLPLLGVVGWVATRPLPAGARPTVRLGLAISAVLALVAWPQAADLGDSQRGNPTVLPRDELAGLLAYLAVVWLVVGLLLLRRARRPAGTTVSDRGGGG
jgi:hypothetical protein